MATICGVQCSCIFDSVHYISYFGSLFLFFPPFPVCDSRISKPYGSKENGFQALLSPITVAGRRLGTEMMMMWMMWTSSRCTRHYEFTSSTIYIHISSKSLIFQYQPNWKGEKRKLFLISLKFKRQKGRWLKAHSKLIAAPFQDVVN